MLNVRDFRCGYGSRIVVDRASIDLAPGDILSLLGPNGVGKTTLFRSLLNLLPALGGEILLDGENVARWTSRDRARAIAYVPQEHAPPFPYRVEDVVLMGATSRLGAFSMPSAKDRERAAETLDALGIGCLRERVYTEISGGERQMTLIARALMQNPRIMVLDEPTSSLDFANQVRVLALVRDFASSGVAVIMTSHSPAHVFLCSSKVTLMGKDGWIATGTVDEILTEENLRRVYGIPVKIADIALDDGTSVRTCVPLMPPEGGPARARAPVGPVAAISA